MPLHFVNILLELKMFYFLFDSTISLISFPKNSTVVIREYGHKREPEPDKHPHLCQATACLHAAARHKRLAFTFRDLSGQWLDLVPWVATPGSRPSIATLRIFLELEDAFQNSHDIEKSMGVNTSVTHNSTLNISVIE